MAEITATMVKELREITNVGMMECKRALQEAGGDRDKAIKLLRERGLALADKKAARMAKEGVVTQELAADGSGGLMFEVNCETDFVARNEIFQGFVKQLLEIARGVTGDLAPVVKDQVAAQVAAIGENIVVRRNTRFVRQGTGLVSGYVHMGGKIGVLSELGCGLAATAANPRLREIAHEIDLQIAASKPLYLESKDVPADVQAAEREIYAKQVEGKPANIVGKIVDGKIAKFYTQVCLVDQPYIKDPNLSVAAWLAAQAKALGDTLTIRRFVRYQLGQ